MPSAEFPQFRQDIVIDDMAVSVSYPPAIYAGLRGFTRFCALIGEPLQPHERRIARAHFGPAPEVCAVLPRGNRKTTLAALLGVHHLLTATDAAVTIGAASREQA